MSEQLMIAVADPKLCKWCKLPLPAGYHGNSEYHRGEDGDCDIRAEKENRERNERERIRISYERRKKNFVRFDYNHPEVRYKLIEKAREERRGGATKLFIRDLCYRVRKELKIAMCNNHASFYSHDFNQMDEFKGMFKEKAKIPEGEDMAWWVDLLHPTTKEVVVVNYHSDDRRPGTGMTNKAQLNVTDNYREYFQFTSLNGRAAKDTIVELRKRVSELGIVRDPSYWNSTEGNVGYALSILLKWAEIHPNAIWDVN